ncbi:MAG: hypothetical protein JST21_13880 [Bacteroidetes bacterium]|nr:hypothetical protein [Bacteroidota bacterium]
MASLMNLHLQYRLWISNMNEDINVLRILHDYINDGKSKITDAATADRLNKYLSMFVDIRKELDDIRHEMYLNKMRIAAMEKADNVLEGDIEKDIHHEEIKKRYEDFKAKFKEMKKEFKKLEIK